MWIYKRAARPFSWYKRDNTIAIAFTEKTDVGVNEPTEIGIDNIDKQL